VAYTVADLQHLLLKVFELSFYTDVEEWELAEETTTEINHQQMFLQ
jgi:hypothetical protein